MLEAKLLTIDPRTVRNAILELETGDFMPSVIANNRQGGSYARLHISAKLSINFISRRDSLHYEGTLRQQAEQVADYMSNKQGVNIVVGVAVVNTRLGDPVKYDQHDLSLWQQINPDNIVEEVYVNKTY